MPKILTATARNLTPFTPFTPFTPSPFIAGATFVAGATFIAGAPFITGATFIAGPSLLALHYWPFITGATFQVPSPAVRPGVLLQGRLHEDRRRLLRGAAASGRRGARRHMIKQTNKQTKNATF